MDDNVNFRVSENQKKRLVRLAGLSHKTLSDYVRDAALSANIGESKYKFYEGINVELINMQRSQFVITRLMLLLGIKLYGTEKAVMDFYHETMEQAQERYPIKGEDL